MQPGPPAPAATKPPRRRVRSESDRKKHAGWRRCPRCARSVSTNGRNFYHHMHKCDRVFFADVIARIDATRAKLTETPPPQAPQSAVAPLLSPTTPPRPPAKVPLNDNQRAIFMQQLCFLRIYDRTVDSVFRQAETSSMHSIGPSIFEAVKVAKMQQTQGVQPVPYTPPRYSPVLSSPPSRNQCAPVPLPEALASPLTPHNAATPVFEQGQPAGSGVNHPGFRSAARQYQPPQAVYQPMHLACQQQQPLPAMQTTLPDVNQAVQAVPVHYPPMSMMSTQASEIPSSSANVYSSGLRNTPIHANYPITTHGHSMPGPPPAANFSTLTTPPASCITPLSGSVPVSTHEVACVNEPVPAKILSTSNFQRATQMPISVSTPTSISASVAAIAPRSVHLPPSSDVNTSVHMSPPVSNMAQTLTGSGHVALAGNKPAYFAPAQNSLPTGEQETSGPVSEAQPVPPQQANPRQASAMSISSVINN